MRPEPWTEETRSNMTRFPCKHKETKQDGTVLQCPEEVEYDEGDAHVVMHWGRPAERSAEKKTVYLTCEGGHTYPYQVLVAEE
jgi:hypothetical protein